MSSKPRGHLIQAEVLHEMHIGASLWVNDLVCFNQLLLVVHVAIFVVFLIGHMGRVNGIIAAKRRSLIVQIFFKENSPEFLILLGIGVDLYVGLVGFSEFGVFDQQTLTVVLRQDVVYFLGLIVLLPS